MKRIFALLPALYLAFTFSSCAFDMPSEAVEKAAPSPSVTIEIEPAEEPPEAPSEEPAEELTEEPAEEPAELQDDDPKTKYLSDDSVYQIVQVNYTGGTGCRVTLFEKSEDGDWDATLECDGLVGKNGMGKERDGDGKTPVGDFGILTAFGIRDDPGTSLPYIDITDDIYCCGDENYYNQLISIDEYPHDCSLGEHMMAYEPEYNYGFHISYNEECEFGRGFAIFFHCTGYDAYTGGCVAVSEENVVNILTRLDPGARIIILDNV